MSQLGRKALAIAPQEPVEFQLQHLRLDPNLSSFEDIHNLRETGHPVSRSVSGISQSERSSQSVVELTDSIPSFTHSCQQQ